MRDVIKLTTIRVKPAEDGRYTWELEAPDGKITMGLGREPVKSIAAANDVAQRMQRNVPNIAVTFLFDPDAPAPNFVGG